MKEHDVPAGFSVTTATDSDIEAIRNQVLQRLVRAARDPQIAPDLYDKHCSTHTKSGTNPDESY